MSAEKSLYNKERFPNATDKFNQDPPQVVEENAETLLESFNRRAAQEIKKELEN